MSLDFDLLSTVEAGGCSAKLPANTLSKVLKNLPKITHKNLLVDIETHDDAGVYKINDELALVQTTDFFPPVCSNAFEFGQISAANALSDVYAMGGTVLTALNIIMFPAKLPMEILKDILAGGSDKVNESGGVLVGGHTIEDDIPKYGLAVTGSVHPDKVITNSGARVGDILVLTKPIGTGISISAKKLGLIKGDTYSQAIFSMKQLNKKAAEVMLKYEIKGATDITGFGLAGHTLKLAQASNVSIELFSDQVPLFDDIYNLADMGCLPGAAFRNLEFVSDNCQFSNILDYNHKMIMMDAQTSGGMLIACPEEKVKNLTNDLITSGYPNTSIVGKVLNEKEKMLYIL